MPTAVTSYRYVAVETPTGYVNRWVPAAAKPILLNFEMDAIPRRRVFPNFAFFIRVSETLGYVRAEEERRGLIRWLRPEFQNPTGKKQTAIAVADEPVAEKKAAKVTKQSWPKSLSEQAGAVLNSLAAFSSGATAKDIAKSFGRATDGRVERIAEILETLEAWGRPASWMMAGMWPCERGRVASPLARNIFVNKIARPVDGLEAASPPSPALPAKGREPEGN